LSVRDVCVHNKDGGKTPTQGGTYVIGLEVGGNLGLHPVAILEQLLLVVEELLARLGRKLCILRLDNRIDRAGLLAELVERSVMASS
jgi:hypothetical protein